MNQLTPARTMKETQKQTLAAYSNTINRECFWDYDFSDSEIVEMAQHGSDKEKMFLFEKIIENTTDVLKCLSIFSHRDQCEMLLKYNVPKFKHDFLERRYKILKYFIMEEEVDIPELRWNI